MKTSKQFSTHGILTVSLFLIFGSTSFAQKKADKLEIGFAYGHSLMQHNKSQTDGVMRNASYRLESEKYGSGDLLSIVGGHVNSVGLVLNYHLNNKSYIQLGYNRRIRMLSALYNQMQFQSDENENITFDIPDEGDKSIPQYFAFQFLFPTSSEAFFHKSRCVPISYRRAFQLPGETGISLHPGVGFAYFKNTVSQVVRKSPPAFSITYSDFPIQNQVLQQEVTSKFVDDPYYTSNFDLYWHFSLGIQKEFKNGNKMEFDIAYMPNFRNPNYKDYMEFEIETSIYDISDIQNPVLIETIDKGTTRFELRQGGITFSLRYYPKIFKMNARD